MPDQPCSERDLRLEAIRRHFEGEPVSRICRDLHRSRKWFYKWLRRFQQHGAEGLADLARTPVARPSATPAAMEGAIVSIRQRLEAGHAPGSRYGLVGPRAIHQRLSELSLPSVPSLSTIQRTLRRHGLTRRPQEVAAQAYYPALRPSAPNQIHATDIITRHLRGGPAIQNFHTLDLFTRAAHLTPALDKTSVTAATHLLDSWEILGLPWMQQMDNEESFRGGHTHARVLGRVVRSCLFAGVEPLFIPFYEAKRNGVVERFHGVWVEAFWSRYAFTDIGHVRREEGKFLNWYMRAYSPAALEGKTPGQMASRVRPARLTRARRQVIPTEVPVTAGFVHFIRRVDEQGGVVVLNQRWGIGKRWRGHYIWARLETAGQRLVILNQREPDAPWHQIKTMHFAIRHAVHALSPHFQRKRPMCPEDWYV